MKKLVLVLVAAFVLLFTGQAFAEDVNAQIKSLQQQIQAIREGSIQSNSGAAQSISAVQELQSQFEALKSTIEANAHSIQALTDSFNLKLSDMDSRLLSLEEKLRIQTKQVTSAMSTVAPAAAKEAELYQLALTQINNAEFLKAVSTLRRFMKDYPKSDYAPYAQYWLAECYYAMRDFEQAIKEFQLLSDKYPRNEKVPAALLKQAYSFSELNMDSESKLFTDALLKKYPHSKESSEATQWLQRNKNLKESQQTSAGPGQVPLAAGVEVPGKTKKAEPKSQDKSVTNSNEKYR